MNHRCKAYWLLLIFTIGAAGCTTRPYEYGVSRMEADLKNSPPMAEQFYIGKPNKWLDASDWYNPLILLRKLLLWNASVDSHEVSTQTVDTLKTYIVENDLRSLQVHVNFYAPGNQFQRLFRNRTVAAPWRYTIGILSVVNYTILPGRFFGGDAYNPYTNTLYLYSDDPSIALHEGGHAKDFANRKYKGTNAFIYALPLAALYYEAKATSDALGYLESKGKICQKIEAFEILYPAYTTYIAGGIADFNGSQIVGLLGVIPGHLAGQIAALTEQDENCEDAQD